MKQTFTVAAAALAALAHAAPQPLAQRANHDYISSCGNNWMARDDVSSNAGQIARRGYLTAVAAFCKQANGKSVAPGGYLSLATRVYLDGGGDPTTEGRNGYVFFEVHNKQKSGNHQVVAADCTDHFKQLSNDGSKCWGNTHHDTKGGTFQVGADQVSYHALGQYDVPAQDAIDKLYTAGALTNRGGSGGTALSPWPVGFTSDVTPVSCHSHNDYTRDIPLFDALSTGCLSVEGDVWIHGSNLRIGHTDPGDSGPTLEQLYLTPIKQMLDAAAGKGIYPKNNTAGLTLLVDFKGDGASTWDLLATKLAPLRNAGYLSHWDGSKFVQGALTIVASGNAPLAKANPASQIFIDARINEDMSGNNRANTYYASADFSSAVGGDLSGGNLAKFKAQVAAAHAKGFLVRYYNIPNEWQQLFDGGDDRINVDDLNQVASLNWHLQ